MGVPFVKDFDDLAENIANPNPDRPIGNAVGNFGRQVCDRISARPDLFAPTILQSPLRAVCQPYWDKQGYDGPTSAPPFTGGQCDDNYLVTWNSVNSDNTTSGSTILVRGPIYGIRRNIISPTEFQIEIESHNLNSGIPTCGTLPNFGRAWRVVISGSRNPPEGTQQITNVSPCGLDNCGDPPSENIPGQNPAPDPGPLPPGTGPQFDVRGNPIFVLPPSVEVSPNFDIDLPDGEINLGSGTGNSPPLEPLPGSETTGVGSGIGGGDSDFPEPPEGERWVGCCINITSRPLGHGSIPQSEPETIFPDIIGNVRLKFSSSSQLPAYDTPLINKSKTLCVWEPVRGMRPIGVRVNLRPGFEYSYTPYSVPLEN